MLGVDQVRCMRALISFCHAALLSVLPSVPLWANTVSLGGSDLVQVLPNVWTAPELALPESDPELPILGPAARQDGARLLRHLSGVNEINGFAGVLYDNRDRGHSTLDPEVYPQLPFLKYSPELVEKELDFGLAGHILLPVVVLGNSSTAMTGGAMQRSLPRLAMTQPFWRAVTPLLYTNNHIYVYPEHRDHDAEDRFPLNWPYMIVSQGSSGSDKAFLGAVAMTLAAFPSDTFATLDAQRLVAPTVQMILRHNLKSVESRADYLSGRAHPPVFDGRDIRPGRMVAQAAEMRPEDIPPLVRLRVTDESFAEAAGLAGLSERLIDSPSAIGRLWRGFAWEQEMTVTAEDTVAPNDRPFTFEWRLLRGDPDLVQIVPQSPDGRTARIRIAWHDPWTETETRGNKVSERRLSRVDIGVFAHNGVNDSAPALISIDFPEHQARAYTNTAKGRRLASVDYNATGRGAYFDPILYWTAPWTDTARYDEAGALEGWERRGPGEETAFVPSGADMLPAQRHAVDTSDPGKPVLRPISE
ncbi:hypothetical protein ACOXXX_19945 [Thalassococcus sp. BH17M4-6]|uniref:hypothetical protein n=1 Tax=Thalassococcus sp. BH17M4-6 TaxID=3413148 RepID=UPI003BBDB48C